MSSLCVCMFVWLNFQWLCVCILVWMRGYVCVCPCACVILRVGLFGVIINLHVSSFCPFCFSVSAFVPCVHVCDCCLRACLCLYARMPVTTFCSLPFQSSMRLLVFMYKWFRICKRVCLFCCTAICLCYHLPVFLLVCVSVLRNLFAYASFVPYVLSSYLPVSLYA